MILAHAGEVPGFHLHIDSLLLVGAIVGAYALIVHKIGSRIAAPGAPAVTRRQMICFGLGVATIWLAAGWPIHDLAEESMYSVHMVQHLLLSMVATPLLLLGTPGWMARWILRPPSLGFRIVRRLARFVPALVVFNVVLVLTHWPALVNSSLESHGMHFLVHAMIFGASLIIWLPIVSPLPEIPRLAPPTRAAFLFLQSIVPTVPASFLTFGKTPLYKFYEGAPHIFGATTLEDQQVAGLIMKIGAGILLWMLIAVIFFRWAAEEDRNSQPHRLRKELERELEQIRAEHVEGVKG